MQSADVLGRLNAGDTTAFTSCIGQDCNDELQLASKCILFRHRPDAAYGGPAKESCLGCFHTACFAKTVGCMGTNGLQCRLCKEFIPLNALGNKEFVSEMMPYLSTTTGRKRS